MYTEERKREALRVLDERNGRVTAAMGRPGCPSRQCFCQWVNERDAARVRENDRPFPHCSEQTRDDAIRLLDSGTGAEDIADRLGALNTATVHDRAGAAQDAALRFWPARLLLEAAVEPATGAPAERLGDGGLFRQVGERVLLPSRLEGRRHGRAHAGAERVPSVLQRRARQGVPRLVGPERL